jgi:hypothetical protein
LEGIVKFFDSKRLYGLIQILDEWGDWVFDEFLFVKTAVVGPIPWKNARVTFWLADAPASSKHPLVAVEVQRLDEFEPRAPLASVYLADQHKDELAWTSPIAHN